MHWNKKKYVKEKHLQTDIAALKKYISTNVIKNIKWIKSSDQLADILTKQSANLLPLINALNDGFIYLIWPRIMLKDLRLVYTYDSPHNSCVWHIDTIAVTKLNNMLQWLQNLKNKKNPANIVSVFLTYLFFPFSSIENIL